MSDPFDLLPEDVEYLDEYHQGRWHKLEEGNGKYGLTIEDFSIPTGFNQSKVSLLILIPSGYPASPLDMFYFDPHLSKLNGGEVGALSTEMHFGRNWQRWSRHYEWILGEDNLVRHIEQVSLELKSTVSE